jgi:hypothetical protein
MSRRQPAHLRFPLTDSQVESLDEMLYELYKRLSTLEDSNVASTTPSSTSGGTARVAVGPQGDAGQDGDPGPPGRDGVNGTNTTLESRVIQVGETRTIADTFDRIYVDYLYIKGTLSLQGDGALAIL